MNNTQLRTLSFVAIVAGTLLSVAVITALSTIEEADARHKSRTSTSQSIRQSNNGEVARLPVIMESVLATSK